MKGVAVAAVMILAIAGTALAMWPAGPITPVHEGILRDVQVTVGGSGTDGFAMIVFADAFVGIVPISSLQTRSWTIGSYCSLGGRSRLWPRGPQYWIVQKEPPTAVKALIGPDGDMADGGQAGLPATPTAHQRDAGATRHEG